MKTCNKKKTQKNINGPNRRKRSSSSGEVDLSSIYLVGSLSFSVCVSACLSFLYRGTVLVERGEWQSKGEARDERMKEKSKQRK